MKKVYCVRVEWDGQTKKWIASSDDIPGLAAQSDTTWDLVKELKLLIPVLFERNGRRMTNPILIEVLGDRVEIEPISGFFYGAKRRLRTGLQWACIAAIAVVFAWMAVYRDTTDYPDKWPTPAIFMGFKGGCPNIAGEYVVDNEMILHMLQSQMTTSRIGGSDWFERKAVVTQADDGSWLKIETVLSERGLVASRDRIGMNSVDQSSSSTLLLKRDVHYRCYGRWLRGGSSAQMSVGNDRKGNLIVARTFSVSRGIDYFNIQFSMGGSSERARWYRWLKASAK